jgi:hypothetical protein
MRRTLPVGSYAVTPDGRVYGATADDESPPPKRRVPPGTLVIGKAADHPDIPADKLVSPVSNELPASESYWAQAGRLGGPE